MWIAVKLPLNIWLLAIELYQACRSNPETFSDVHIQLPLVFINDIRRFNANGE